MKEGKVSTKRFNEWICVTAQYEKAVARLGRQVYQGFSRGLVTDHTSMEICRDISETFAEAKSMRADLEEELERDALDGLNVEEAKKAEETLKLSQAQVTKRRLKLKFHKLMGRQSVNRSLAAHRDHVKELSRDLGLRALACYADDPILKIRGHKSLCKLAERLCDEADKKWQEITTSNKKGASGLSFHTVLFGFVGDFAKFSKNTQVGRMILKFFKYDEQEEKEKLTKRFEGSSSATALRAQMEEVEEPHLDVGREIDNMQQEYQEAPEEWNMPQEESVADQFEDEFIQVDDEADDEVWESEGNAWNPDDAVDEDFLGAVAAAPDLPPVEPTPKVEETFEPAPPQPAGPTLLRDRGQSGSDPWADPSDSSPPPAPVLPTVGMAPQLKEASEPKAKAGTSDDWGWGAQENEPEAEAEPQAANWNRPAPSKTDSWDKPAPTGKTDSWDKPATNKTDSWDKPENSPKPPASQTSEVPGTQPDPFAAPATSGKRPPFMKSGQKEKPLGEWNDASDAGTTSVPVQPQNDGWGSAPAATQNDGWGSAPAAAQNDGWSKQPSQPSDDGWSKPAQPAAPPSTPAPATPPPPAPTPKAAPPPTQPTPSEVAPPAPPAPKGGDEGDSLGDDLLPAFLRDRVEDSSEDDSFIPELPSFLETEDGPELEIVPFGSPSADKRKKDQDKDDDAGFIPSMPD